MLFRRISVEGVCISAPEVRMPAVEQERARSSAAPADPTPVPPEEIVSDDDPGSYFATLFLLQSFGQVLLLSTFGFYQDAQPV